MLKRVKPTADIGIKIFDANPDMPFKSGLEYGAPARGTWNIVHTGMLIPEAHQIFVCASNCLRGVVLTAAEMNAENRFSTIEIKENNVLNGDMEQLITDGVADIISRLKKRPPAILLYTSCIHHFIGCDMQAVFKVLRINHPDIDFTDCYMNPIMRKSGLDPDKLMRRQLYSLLKKSEQAEKSINIVGNDLATDKSSELVKIIARSGFSLHEITDCKTYSDYLALSKSSLNITYYPPARPAGEYLLNRLEQKHLYLPVSFELDEIRQEIDTLIGLLGGEKFDHSSPQNAAEKKLAELSSLLSGTPVAIDYTAVSRPFQLAKLLCSHGINVTKIYSDSISGEDKESFLWLQKNSPDIMLFPTVNANMRVIPRTSLQKTVAIGQKAAYFTGSDNFVNIIEGGGHWGYDGIIRICDEITDAYLHEKSARQIIQIKGWGCGCC